MGPGYYQGTLTPQGGSQSTPVVAIIADNSDGAMSAQDGTLLSIQCRLFGNHHLGNVFRSLVGYRRDAKDFRIDIRARHVERSERLL